MVATLPTTSHQDHSEILPHVDALRAIADDLADPDVPGLRHRLRREVAFLYAQLMPHLETAEARLYPRLEELLGDRHALEPFRREHKHVRRLIEEIDDSLARLSSPLRPAQRSGLRRALYRLFGLLSVHLAEEEQYLPVLGHDLSEEELAELVSGMRHARLEPL